MIKNILLEFKKFVMRGNVIDMSVGIIIGAAFTKIVNSIVSDILMPPLGLLMGKVDFSNWFIVLKPGAATPGPYESLSAAQAAGATTLNVGNLLNAVISFLIVAICIFLLIKLINKLDALKKSPIQEPTTKKCPYCCMDIPLEATRCPSCTSHLK